MTTYEKLMVLREQEYLSLNDAALVFGIGKNSLRRLTDEHEMECVLWVGNKRYIRQAALRNLLHRSYCLAS